MADLRAAIIGYGLAGRFFHAPLIAATEGLVLASVVTSSHERQAQVSREHPDAQILTSPAELWQSAAEHDLVVVATPNEAHAPLATEAIDRGLPVVVDKPLALSSREADELITRSERSSTLLSVFQNRRWDSDQLTLARLLAEDRLGTVVRYESHFERWRPSASAAPGPRLRVLGTNAAFVVQELDGEENALRSGMRPDQVPDWGSEPVSHWGRLVTGEESVAVPSERGDWPRFYELLGRALRDGYAPPVDPHDAVMTLRVLEAARLSAANREVVTLPG